MLGFVPAVPAAFDLVAVVVAVMVVLLLMAGYLICDLLARIVRPLPFVGGILYNFLHNSLAGTLKSLNSLWEPLVWVLARVLWASVTGLWNMLYQMANTSVNAKKWALQAYARAVQANNDAILRIQAEAQRAGTAEGILTGQLIEAQAALQVDIQTETRLAEVSADNTAYGYMQNAEAYTDYRLSQLGTTNLGALQSEVASLQSQVAQLTGTVTNDFTQAEGDIRNSTQVMMQVVNNAQAQDKAYTDTAVAGSIPTAVAAAVAQLAPTLQRIETDIGTCLDPLCETVTPSAKNLGELGKLLQDLEGLFAAGALMALLVAAVEDPKGTATVVSDTMGWVSPLSLDLVHAVGDAAGVVL